MFQKPSKQAAQAQYFLILLALFLGFQVIKVLLATPIPAFGGDAAGKWNLARDVAHGSVALFNTGEAVSHHFLRWGTWLIPSALIHVFSDDLIVYYLATAVPATLAALTFIYIAFRWIGLTGAAVFAVVWFFDPQIYSATFQLLPTGSALLPLALALLLIFLSLEKEFSTVFLSLSLAALSFWLYGAKETNLFFAPGILAVLTLQKGKAGFLWYCGAFLTLYGAETAIFMAISDHMGAGGRVHALLSSQAPHLNGMMNSQRLVSQQADLWDAGILSRWYSVMVYHIPVYLLSIPLFFYFILRHLRRGAVSLNAQRVFVVSVVATSFVLCTSFFIISLDPLRLGQPLRSRYVALLLPFSYLVLLFVLAQLRARILATLLAITAVLVVCAAIALVTIKDVPMSKITKVLRNDLFYAQSHPLLIWRNYYSTVGRETPNPLCAHNRRGPIASDLLFVPERDRSPTFKDILRQPITKEDNLYRRGTQTTCGPNNFIADSYLKAPS